jgi:hypothetical protein
VFTLVKNLKAQAEKWSPAVDGQVFTLVKNLKTSENGWKKKR